MPTYDYYCPENGQTVEVSHRISESISTWGEICERAGMESNGIPIESPVRRVLSSPYIGGANSSSPAPSPQQGGGGGGCGRIGGCGCH